MTIQQNIY